MTTNLQIGDRFPDIEEPDHQNEPRRLSQFTKAGLRDQRLGPDGYPLTLVYRRFTPPPQQPREHPGNFPLKMSGK